MARRTGKAKDRGALFEQIDPTRSYGELSFEDVQEAVVRGELTLSEGADEQPIIIDREGRPIEGSGEARPPAVIQQEVIQGLVELRKHQGNRDWFDRKLTVPITEVYSGPTTVGKEDLTLRDWLVTQAVQQIADREKGSQRLIEMLLNQHIGKPKETINSATDILAERLMAALATEVPLQLNEPEESAEPYVEGEFEVVHVND